MKFELVTGPTITVECVTCRQHVIGGSEPYTSAATGEPVQPGAVYLDIEGEPHKFYCSECAAKLAEPDPTRAVNQFYSDTTGNAVEPEHILE